MLKIEDKLGRRFEKLRISLLNSCNFSCVYCVDNEFDENTNLQPDQNGTDKPISVEEFTQLIRAVHRLTSLKSVRLTGGEPLLYSNLYPLIENIKKLGINDIRLTTNAFFLKENAEKLVNAGVNSINIWWMPSITKPLGKLYAVRIHRAFSRGLKQQ